MPQVYRLEMENGRGVYQSSVNGSRPAFNGIYTDYATGSNHPPPWRDRGMSRFWDSLEITGQSLRWFFGFTSLEQLQAWFYRADDRTRMADNGVVMRVYEVPEKSFVAGQYQAIFRKEDAKLVLESKEF